MDMKPLRSKNRKAESQYYGGRAAAEIMRLAQGTPVVGYHDENGTLVIPAELDDEDEFRRRSSQDFSDLSGTVGSPTSLMDDCNATVPPFHF